MSTTYTLSRPIPLAEFTANLPAMIGIDPDPRHTRSWVADGKERSNMLLRTDTDCMHAFAESGMVISLERYGGNKAEPMVLAICERFDVHIDADFGWTYPEDGTCEEKEA